MDTEITWKWEATTSFHIGSGFSRAGLVDRTVRLDKQGHAILPSDAVKGAIRGAAEQMSRWMGSAAAEREEDSIPENGVLRRIFAPNETAGYIRFCGCKSEKPVRVRNVSSTKIDPVTRSADDNTLRTIEMVPKGATFQGRIQLLAGDWLNPSAPEHQDALFLLAALAMTDSAGAKKGTGLGRFACRDLKLGTQPAWGLLNNEAAVKQLQDLAKGSVE